MSSVRCKYLLSEKTNLKLSNPITSVKHGGESPSEDVLVISSCEYSVFPVEQEVCV